MTSSHHAAAERTRSPWLYVLLGGVLVVALAVLGFFFGGSLLTQMTSRAAEGDETVTVGSDESAVTVVAPTGWVIVPHYFGKDTVTLRSPDARLEIVLQVPDAPLSLVEAAQAGSAETFEALADKSDVPDGVPISGSENLFWIDETPKEGLLVRHASVEYATPVAEGQGASGIMVGSVAFGSASASSGSGAELPNAALVFSAVAEDLELYRPAITQILESIGGPAA